jgi:hypothetical protein
MALVQISFISSAMAKAQRSPFSKLRMGELAEASRLSVGQARGMKKPIQKLVSSPLTLNTGTPTRSHKNQFITLEVQAHPFFKIQSDSQEVQCKFLRFKKPIFRSKCLYHQGLLKSKIIRKTISISKKMDCRCSQGNLKLSLQPRLKSTGSYTELIYF